MGLEFQKFYRFIIPGALLVASNALIILDKSGFSITAVKDLNSFILLLGILAFILGVPLYWIYVVAWHFRFERNKMQTKEIEWLNSKILLTEENIFKYSNVIWHHIDSEEKYKQFANWLRNGFLLIHSLGSSALALLIGFIIYVSFKRCDVFKEPVSLLWLIWLILLVCILVYRFELKKRYMKRLEIFIRLNSGSILGDISSYDLISKTEPSGLRRS